MRTDLYKDHFGFRERPFSLLPDPDFLFWSKEHTRAYSMLEYGLITHAPLTVVTGEVGAGKTTLVQHLLSDISADITVGLISNARGDRDDLLRWVLNALDIEAGDSDDYVGLFQRFQDFVIDEYARGNVVVLIIDEAQNLSEDSLEELRMLTNINSRKDELLQLILLGQPELRDMITRPHLRQFAQRVTATYHIAPLNRENTINYVRHRLRHVGGTGEEFTKAALSLVHDASGGLPRMINKICDLALVYAVSAEMDVVNDTLVQEILDDNVILKTRQTPLVLTNPNLPEEAAE